MRTLVLNAGWVPVNVIDAFDAVGDVFAGKARCLDTSTFMIHDFESWVDNWDEAIAEARVNEERVVSTSSISMILPEIIVLAEYKGMGAKASRRGKPKFSRTNIYRRDKSKCQYCGVKFKRENLTMDHVVPKSKGGLTEWTNIVLACTPCNRDKDNRTPKQAGMKLISEPREPNRSELATNPLEKLKRKIGAKPLRTWEQFLGKMYWEVELK